MPRLAPGAAAGVAGVAGTALVLWLAGPAAALTIDWSDLSDQTSPTSLSQVDAETGTTVTATGSAWGGTDDPQDALDPTDPGASGPSPLGVNVGGGSPGSGAFSTHGLGCGTTLISQCDLISPAGEDALLLTFSDPVTVGTFVVSAMEDADDVSAWSWSGSAWSPIGSDDCSTFSFCTGEEPIDAGPHAPSQHFMLVAEDSGSSAFKLTRIEGLTVHPVPEPAAGGLLGIAAGSLLARRLRRR